MLEEASCPTPSKSNIESRHSDIEPWKSRLQTWKGVIFWYLKYCTISLLLVLEMTNEISISLSVQHWHFFPLFSLIFGDVQYPSSFTTLKPQRLPLEHFWNFIGSTEAVDLWPRSCIQPTVLRDPPQEWQQSRIPWQLEAKKARSCVGESTVSQTLLKQRGATEKTQFAFDLAYIWLFEKFKSAWVVTIERLLNVFLLGGSVWSVGQSR